MEKIKTLVFILGGIVFFVWRMVQKMRETTRREQQERPAARPVPLPNTSFEDLLKQMQQQNQRGNPAVPAPTTPAGRRLPHEEAQKARTLEQPARKAQSQERRATNTSLEKKVAPARPNTGMDHSAQDNPLRRPRPTAPAPAARRVITDRLRTPADLREAFILSEILKRKFE
ncbi:hypothetical protein [Hymenobacter chitinivorans]|uniref:Uncharacterized protein n=1 Tax=Hymenobacter chitinivorans DSM 11115 TaxID=1121954 RepID=A0A2M9BRR6_9BACT|nr:hypothetical protein [Hymenobacter chitinivorans]PJJ60646.1 hypothetical protein CLV45_2075 [Hymenobacter chitinivorans DSM 11115]